MDGLLSFIDGSIILFFLFFGFFGFRNGLVKEILKKSSIIIAFIIAFSFFQEVLEYVLRQEDWLINLEQLIYTNLFSNGGIFDLVPTIINYRDTIREAMVQTNIPTEILDVILFFVFFAAETVGRILAKTVTEIVVYLATFFFLVLFSYLAVSFLLLGFYKKLSNFTGFGIIDQLAGALFGILKVILLIELIILPFLVVSLVFPFVQDWISNLFYTSNQQNSVLFIFYTQTLKLIEFRFDFWLYMNYVLESLLSWWNLVLTF